jgi:hypothetical protein
MFIDTSVFLGVHLVQRIYARRSLCNRPFICSTLDRRRETILSVFETDDLLNLLHL